LKAASARFGGDVTSLGIDTWGVDFGLLGRDDQLLGNPFHYRDRQTEGVMQKAFRTASREEIFAETGIQFMELNTLYQLLAMHWSGSVALQSAESMLMIPDLINWLLTGDKANEFTNATTTQFFNPMTGNWATQLMERFDLPTHLLGTVVQPGTILGRLRSQVAEDTGLADTRVVLPGTHDTASAVMAVPATNISDTRPDWCYISSGTWSLMGVEVSRPIINEKCRDLNFTNEGGVGGTIRVLKNIAGLWLIQECRRIWQQAGRTRNWDDLVHLSRKESPLQALIDPDHRCFLAPADMPETIREFCRRTGQSIPASDGAVVRCALESLALRYRESLGWLEELTGGRIETIHIVGGGARNRLLCQMTSDACQRPVVAGPTEATAIGNVMMQAVASGDIGSIREARNVIRGSFEVEQYVPADVEQWNEAYSRFATLRDT
jgi:rhamnulokinase